MYFPKSQIKSNLYTNGGEYILSTTQQDYTGYYYETSSGQRYTGKTPQDGVNIPLLSTNSTLKNVPPTNPLEDFPIELIDEESNLNYLNIQQLPPNIRFIPQYNPTQPTQQDQNLGVFQRYFCKKNNELKYLEIDKSTHDKLKSKQQDIAWDLYTPISTLWYIKGNKEQTFKANKGLVTLIEEKQKWYGFTQWFKDRFLQYYLES
jgi:hypothetical protein